MGPSNGGRYRKVVVIQRWSLAQVYKYAQLDVTPNFYTFLYSLCLNDKHKSIVSKTACKILVKLTPWVNFINDVRTKNSYVKRWWNWLLKGKNPSSSFSTPASVMYISATCSFIISNLDRFLENSLERYFLNNFRKHICTCNGPNINIQNFIKSHQTWNVESTDDFILVW